MTAGQLPAEAHKRGDEKLNLVAIGRARNSDIFARHRNVRGLSIGNCHSFIVYRAVSRGSLQGLAEGAGRSLDIIQQAKFPKVEALSKPKSEKFVRQLVRYNVEKSNLISDSDTSVWVFNLFDGQSSSFEQGGDIEPFQGLRKCRPCNSTGGGGESIERSIIGLVHVRAPDLGWAGMADGHNQDLGAKCQDNKRARAYIRSSADRLWSGMVDHRKVGTRVGCRAVSASARRRKGNAAE
jgi:hypothetical protein